METIIASVGYLGGVLRILLKVQINQALGRSLRYSHCLHKNMASISGISPRQLPDWSRTELDFPESTFFKVNGPTSHLPTPFEVRAASQGDPTHPQPPPVIFESLNLLVKYGPHMCIFQKLYAFGLFGGFLEMKSQCRSSMAGELRDVKYLFICNLSTGKCWGINGNLSAMRTKLWFVNIYATSCLPCVDSNKTLLILLLVCHNIFRT